jgi:hypothetical protein
MDKPAPANCSFPCHAMSCCRYFSSLLTFPVLVLIFKHNGISRLAPLALSERLFMSHRNQKASPTVQEMVRYFCPLCVTRHSCELTDIFSQPFSPKYTTTFPSCPFDDSLFFTSTVNYTYQIQCGISYTAATLTELRARTFHSCMAACDQHNAESVESHEYCVGVTFHESEQHTLGLCSLFSKVEALHPTCEDDFEQESALLIIGPDGLVAAEPLGEARCRKAFE